MSTEPRPGEGRVYNHRSLGLARPGRHGDLPLGWVLEAWRKAWPTQHERENPELPRQVVEEGIQGSEKLICQGGHSVKGQESVQSTSFMGKPDGHYGAQEESVDEKHLQ